MRATKMKFNLIKLIVEQSIELQRMNYLLYGHPLTSKNDKLDKKKTGHLKVLHGITLAAQSVDINVSIGTMALGLDKTYQDCCTAYTTFKYENGNLMFEAFVSDLISKLESFSLEKLIAGDIHKWFKQWYDVQYLREFGPPVTKRLSDDEVIKRALKNMKVLFDHAPIIKHFKGYIVIAQSKTDLKAKKQKISRGDTLGFVSIQVASEHND